MKMGWFTRYSDLIDKLVVEIDVRGCMADDHRFKRIGVVVEIENQRARHPGAQSMIQAKCRVVESRETVEDEFFYVSIDDGCFQRDDRIPCLLWWRH